MTNRPRLGNLVAAALFTVSAFGMATTVRATTIAPNTFAAGMDTVFSQAAFGGNTIDIRFNAIITLNNASLLSIDSSLELTTLLSSVAVPANTVSMYFVALNPKAAVPRPTACMNERRDVELRMMIVP